LKEENQQEVKAKFTNRKTTQFFKMVDFFSIALMRSRVFPILDQQLKRPQV
jgi:hypothetical protein